MSRFEFRGDYAMRPQSGNGNLLAYFNVIDTETGIEFRDMRLVEGRNGVFVAGPFRSYEDKTSGETKYSDYIRAAYEGDDRNEKGVQWFEELTQAAYAHFETLSKGGEKPTPARSSKPAAGARRSGRGPAPAVGATADNAKAAGKKQLPF
jgi:DNA-binding cell septation regulator SpoVG